MSGVASPRTTTSQRVLAFVFIGAGLIHFIRPSSYLGIMPPYLPQPLLLVYLSGAAELIGGIGVLVPRWRRAAGWWLMLTLVAVFPANVQMLQNWMARGASTMALTVLWLRLPLQVLLIWWVWRATQPARAADV